MGYFVLNQDIANERRKLCGIQFTRLQCNGTNMNIIKLKKNLINCTDMVGRSYNYNKGNITNSKTTLQQYYIQTLKLNIINLILFTINISSLLSLHNKYENPFLTIENLLSLIISSNRIPLCNYDIFSQLAPYTIISISVQSLG